MMDLSGKQAMLWLFFSLFILKSGEAVRRVLGKFDDGEKEECNPRGQLEVGGLKWVLPAFFQPNRRNLSGSGA